MGDYAHLDTANSSTSSTAEPTFKATATIARQTVLKVKKAWYKRAEDLPVTNHEQLVIAGLTEAEAEHIQTPFSMKLIGLFVGAEVSSVKVERE